MDNIQEMHEGIYGLMKELREFRHEMSEFRQEVNDRLTSSSHEWNDWKTTWNCLEIKCL